MLGEKQSATGVRAKPPRKHYPHKPQGKVVLQTLDTLDGRSLAARRVRATIASMTRALNVEHRFPLTDATKTLIQRAAMLNSMIESNEAKWISGDASFDLSAHMVAINSERRILSSLGLIDQPLPQPHNVETLQEIAERLDAQHASEALEADADVDVIERDDDVVVSDDRVEVQATEPTAAAPYKARAQWR